MFKGLSFAIPTVVNMILFSLAFISAVNNKGVSLSGRRNPCYIIFCYCCQNFFRQVGFLCYPVGLLF